MALDPETLGLLAAIGIEKGKPFSPNDRMKKILADAAAVGNATRATARSSRLARRKRSVIRIGDWQTGPSAAATSSRKTACACSMRAYAFFY